MSFWQDIVTNALLGTERKTFAIEQVNGAMGDVLSKLDMTQNEAALLNCAAVVALHNEAGKLPMSTQADTAVCDTDEMPVCSERAAQHLALMLSGEYKEALDEWLTTLASTNKRVRELLLPTLLNYGNANKEHRGNIIPVLGKRGVWLAGQNPAWHYATGENPDEEIWQTGSSEERLNILKLIRKKDAAKALRWISESWKQESHQDRLQFLYVLQTNLSMDDEPFLESALDDKRKEVRSRAAYLLTGLPESRLCKRMIERALLLFTYKQGLRPEFEVILPEECDKAMTRDGIDASSPYSKAGDKLGQKAYLLSQILGAIPIQFWRKHWNVTTREILKLTERNEWNQILDLAWFHATQRFADAEMADALLEVSLTKEKKLFSPLNLINVVTPTRREEILHTVIQFYGANPSVKSTVVGLMNSTSHLWSESLTRTILRHAYKYIKAGDIAWLYSLRSRTFYMAPVAALEEIAKWQLELKDNEKQYLIEYIEAPLNFRREMLAELMQES